MTADALAGSLPPKPSPARRAAALVGVVLLAAALRLWALDWGLPLRRGHIDEYVTVFYAMNLFLTGPHPHFFDYPSLFLYALWGAAAALGRLTGDPAFSAAGFLQAQAAAPILAGRALSVLFALAGVFATMEAARRWRGAAVALWAGLFLALHPVHVRMSHYAMPDALSVALAAGAVWAWVVFLQEGRARQAAAAGAFLGLAAAAKYTPGFLAPGLLLWLLLARRGRAAGAFCAAALAGFLAGFPYALIAWAELVPRLAHLFGNFTSSEGGESLIVRFGRALAFLPRAVHPALFAAAAVGAWLARGPLAASLGLAALTYFLGVGGWAIQAERYYLPLVPIACLWAGSAVVRLSERRRAAGLAAVAAVAIALAAPSARFLADLSREDTRLRALAMVRAQVPEGASLLRFPHTPEFTRLDPYRISIDWEGRFASRSPAELLGEYDYLLTAHYEPEAADWERRLSAEAREVFSVAGPAPSFPHHPRVRLWTRRDG